MHEVDLHLHTTHSDGTLSPTELVDLCAQNGLKVIAISDHDSTEGVAEAQVAAIKHGIEIIPAIELSTDVPDNEIHMLGYFIDMDDADFQDLLREFRAGREDRGRKMVERLADLGMDITWEEVEHIADGGAVGRPHIAQAMIERGYVSVWQEAFDKYIGRTGPAYVERTRLEPEDAVRVLLDNGALPVMAHPLYYEREDTQKLRNLVASLKEAGMIGLEVHYGEFSESEIDMLANIAAELDLVPCGGSDYHASGKPGESHPRRGRPTHEHGRGPAREEGYGEGAMTITAAAFIVGAYLLGAIPSSYLVARWLKGVDIRESGSGNVGASNLSEHVGAWVGVSVGVFDTIGKATVPILLAQFFDQSLTVQAAVGLAAVLGHNWSPYLQMTGGRGISTVIGIMVAFLMWPEMLIGVVVIGIVGGLWLKDLGFWTFAMIVALPGLVYLVGFFDLFERDMTLVILFICVAIALLAKRLTANWERPERGYNWRVFLYRILWDRDVRRQEEWTRRGIEGEAT